MPSINDQVTKIRVFIGGRKSYRSSTATGVARIKILTSPGRRALGKVGLLAHSARMSIDKAWACDMNAQAGCLMSCGSRGDGSYSKVMRQLARRDLLILDDLGHKPLTQTERHDLLEIIEDRHDLHPTIITSQLPISSCHSYLNEPRVADALPDRLLTKAHRIELKG